MNSKLISDLKNLTQAVKIDTPEGLFGRKCLVKTGNLVFNMDELDIEVNSVFDDSLNANEAEISIYNLTDGTIAALVAGTQVTVEAGYKEDTGVIFSGKIDQVKTRRAGKDRKTTIYAVDKISGGVFPQKAYKANTKAGDILKDLLAKAGIPIAQFRVGRSRTFTDAVSLSGSLAQNIKKYSDICDTKTYVSNGKLYTHSVSDPGTAPLIVDIEHGLVDSVEEISGSTNGIRFETLLIHQVRVGSIVDLKSINKTGRYVVSKCRFTINEEEFYSEIEANAVR